MSDTPEKKSLAKSKKAKQPALTVVEKTGLDTLLELLNEEYSVILRGSQVFIMRNWLGEDRKRKIIFLSKRDFLIYQENNKLWTADAEGNKEAIKIAPAWMQWGKRKTYEEVYFEPRGEKSDRRYNLWEGFAVKESAVGSCELFLAHIKDNICKGDKLLHTWIMAWLADMFQNPSHKPGTALILRGGMGVGKGIFAHHIGRLFGLHYMSITQPSQLTGKFNGHMMDKILMFVDEGWWDDDRNGGGTLNALITEPSIAIEMKGKDAVYIPNFTRFIISANADRIVQTGLRDERRMAIVDVGADFQQDKEYFNAIDEQMKAGGYEALLYHLLNHTYDKLLPRTIPQTEALADHRLYSMPEEMKWWQHCLYREAIGDYNLSNTMPPDNDIEADKFYEVYLKYCKDMQVKPLPINILPKRLKSYLEIHKIQKHMGDSSRKCFYQLQAVSDLKRKFEDALGNIIDWNEA